MDFAVLGLGKTIDRYSYQEARSVGVNDVYRHRRADYVVCVDPPSRFTEERRTIIRNCRPKKFFSNVITDPTIGVEGWESHPCFEKIELHSPRGKADYFADGVAYGNMSVLPAMVLAVKLGASSLTLYGVDIKDHERLGNEHNFQRSVDYLQDFVWKCPVPVTLKCDMSQYIKVR